MKIFVTNAELQLLENDLRDAPDRLESATDPAQHRVRLMQLQELAWHLRQRDTLRALALVATARESIAAAALSTRERELVSTRLQLIEGEAQWLFAQFVEAEDTLRTALTRFEAIDDAIGCADAHWALATLMVDLGRPEERDAELARSGEQARMAGDSLRADLADAAMARWAVFASLHQARERWGNRFGPDVSQLHPGLLTWVYDFWALLAFQTGDFAKSLTYRLPSYDLANDTGQLQRAIIGACNIGGAFGNLNDHQTALEWMERGLSAARSTGWPACIGNSLMQTAEILRHLGRFENAQDMLEQALERLGGQLGSRTYATTLQYLGDLQLDRHDNEVALTTFINLEQAAISLNQVDMHMVALRGRAAALLRLGRRAEAQEVAELSLALAQRQGDAYNQIEALRVLAQIYAERPTQNIEGDSTARRAPAPSAAQTRLAVPTNGKRREPSALSYLEQALAAAATIEGYTVSGAMLDQIAHEYAQIGDWQRAYGMALQAISSREKTTSMEAVNRAIAMQISHQTERARAEGEHHRELAASEARRAQTLQQTSDTLERLSVIGQEITAHLDAEAIFHTLERQVNGLLDATHFSIFLVDQEGIGLDCAFGVEQGKALPPLRVLLTSPTSQIARCARERGEILNELDKPLAHNPNLIPGTLPSLSALFAPLAIGDRLLGVMSIQSPLARVYAERERLVFRTLCAYGAIGLDNAATYRQLEAALQTLRDTQLQLIDKNSLLEGAYRELEHASLTDPLTGLHNRRYLLQHAENEVALTLRRHRRLLKPGLNRSNTDTDLVFLMIDIDHFKAVNDQFGHAAGDLVLVQMRERLQKVARATDYIIRWGGEEFLVVARATNRLDAALLAERLRLVVAQQPFDIGLPQPLSRTCSVGFACFPFLPTHPSELSWSQVVELADQALYMAKRGGRDGWVGLYGTAASNPENLFQRITQHADLLALEGEIQVVRSKDVPEAASMALPLRQ